MKKTFNHTKIGLKLTNINLYNIKKYIGKIIEIVDWGMNDHVVELSKIEKGKNNICLYCKNKNDNEEIFFGLTKIKDENGHLIYENDIWYLD